MTSYDYKIDFSDVRREKEMTFFVFPRRYVPIIQKWLTNSGIGGWEFKSIKDARPYLPDHFEIPVIQGKTDPYPITEPKYLMVFLSFYNTDDLRAKFEYMTESLDAANLSLAMGDEREAFRQAKEREDAMWYRDPPPTSSLRQDQSQFDQGGKGEEKV